MNEKRQLIHTFSTRHDPARQLKSSILDFKRQCLSAHVIGISTTKIGAKRGLQSEVLIIDYGLAWGFFFPMLQHTPQTTADGGLYARFAIDAFDALFLRDVVKEKRVVE